LELALLDGGDGATTTDRPMASQPTPQPAAQPAPAQPTPAQPARPTPAPPEKSAAAKPVPAKPVPAKPVQAVKIEVESYPAQSEPIPVRSASASSSTTSANDALAELIAAWPQIVERVSRNPADRPLINACRPVEVSGATIVLGFPENQAFMRDIATRKQRKLEEGIGEVLGRVVAVRCVATNVELIPQDVIASAQDGEDLVEQARKIFADDLADVAEVD
jgi:hypothetical protein